ncbi:glycerol-3-phosphate 1-O-acyltransferase PlsY [Sphingorhabdus sp. Alg239-R122]|uniref:glycerol-3-phosphate 1-O-acyltransferase PlsY n=1 Tax=Sphingorhabdus sp. Alg239-R122 TaxID=2305989 RepID=UPI0013DA14A8|nr:glycerol-3-phosphate 1-O-acyltransferase PlsY [Sphingorhabdus sp. Alg239-R122]
MGEWTNPALMGLLGYLLGSIPFGLVLTRLTGAGDLRSIGSGNIGATNVLRTGSKGLAAATLLLDIGKGAAAVLIAEALFPGMGKYAGLAAFLGHLYPVWLKFSGGKGVATLLGISLALNWMVGLVFALVWLVAAFAFRYSSLSGILASVSTPFAAWLLGAGTLVPVFVIMALLVIAKHRGNIARLASGEEPKIGKS